MSDLDEIAKLEPNWDGYDGVAFDPVTIQNARIVLAALEGAGFIVDVSPMSNGCVGFEWRFGKSGGVLETGKTRGVGYVDIET
jgi:hypothetical protein